MRDEIERLRTATRELAKNGRLSALSRVQGAPPLRTLTTFNTGADPSARTLKRLEVALQRFAATGDEAAVELVRRAP